MEEKNLTEEIVKKLGLDRVSVITADMLEGYTSIGEYAFRDCNSLTSVTIPNSVTSIGEWVFAYCSGLTSMTIPNSVTSIGEWAFSGCSGLTSVTIPNSVTSIGESAFDGCSKLTSVTIPNSVTSIGKYAFSSCSGLTSVTIPNSVTSIGESAFYGCSSLTSINVVNDNPNYSSKDGVLFNKQQTTLIQCPGGKQSAYVIPNSVTSIGGSAFKDCSSLTNVTIGNSVTSIGESAFSDCISLTSVTIPNSVTSIGDCAFYNCKFGEQRRIIAYKGFNADMTCRDFQYKEGETYEIDDDPVLCKRGFHACLNPLDCFNYYSGEIGKNVVFHEVYIDGVSDEKSGDSKVVAKKITIGREISPSEMADIASGRK